MKHSLPCMRGSVFEQNRHGESVSHVYLRLLDGILKVSKCKKSSSHTTIYLYDSCVRLRGSSVVSVRHSSGSLKFECKNASKAKSWYSALKRSSTWTIDDFYTTGRLLGEGAFGKVFAAKRNLDGMRVAVKTIPREYVYDFNEIDLLSSLDHPNIIQALDILHTAHHTHIVLPRMDCDLHTWMRKKGGSLCDREARDVTRQILSGLSYLHEKGIIHHDMKPANILCKRTGQGVEVRIADLGLAMILTSDEDSIESAGLTGTKLYAAPEHLRQQRYSFAIDMWACGLILYNILTGMHPFSKQSSEDALASGENYRYSSDDANSAHLSSRAKSLLSKLLESDPKKRISARKAALHRWL